MTDKTDLEVVYLVAVVEEPEEVAGVQLVAVAGSVEAGLLGPWTEVRARLQGRRPAASLDTSSPAHQVVVHLALQGAHQGALHAQGGLDGVRE